MIFVFVQGESGGIIQLAEDTNDVKEAMTGTHVLKAVGIEIGNLNGLVSYLKENAVEFLGELIETPAGIKCYL
ncbi:hypothetical protein G9F73_006970 [Clostridium estertheticum]|uniref:hypothetical protein n=1 Tax=Clostridium estertheticum TaxID=238834 RepID=UPI0013EE9C1E|nr:hypothetical protein [Clostridium estertheticum]MBZ9607558.1 hypothetical protein [Clostridium estertheticum]